MDYSQPDFYRFNEDSLKLVDTVCKYHHKASLVLDAGSGCGVIGIELARRIQIDELHLLELQTEFEEHLEINLKKLIPHQKAIISQNSFSQYSPSKSFDLIVCNPPYYLPGKGEASKNPNRGVCRSFQIDSWKELLDLFQRSLKLSGSAWVVVKNDRFLHSLIEKEVKNTSLDSWVLPMDDITFLKFTLNSEYKC